MPQINQYEVPVGTKTLLVTQTVGISGGGYNEVIRQPDGTPITDTNYVQASVTTDLALRLEDGSVIPVFNGILSSPYDRWTDYGYYITPGGTIWIYSFDSDAPQKLYETVHSPDNTILTTTFYLNVGSVYYFDTSSLNLIHVADDVVGGYTGYSPEHEPFFRDSGVSFWQDFDHWQDVNVDNSTTHENDTTYSTDGVLTNMPADPGAFFSSGPDTVDYNALSAEKSKIAEGGANIYDGLGGNDVVNLPNTDHYQLTTNKVWDPGQTFHAGAGDDKVTGGNGGDNVDLGAGNDTFFGSLGNDHVWGGDGSDTIDYGDVNLSALSADLTETLDGGPQVVDGPTYLPAQPDVLRLPGRQSDYVITTSALGTKLQHTGPNGTVTFDTIGIEKVYFKDQTLNDLQLKASDLLKEMVQQTVDVYDPGASALVAARKWEPLSAIELGLLPTGSFEFLGSSHYSMVEGFYRATWNAAFNLNFPDTAVADVAVGSINGKSTLSLSFEGTVEKTDWLYNLSSFAAYYSKYSPLIEAIDRYVKDNGIQQVLVEGHSLGASMVQLFMNEHPDSPTVSYKAFTVALPGILLDSGYNDDPRTIGIIHTKDIVGHFPLFHNGTQVYIDASYSGYSGPNSVHLDQNYAADFANLLSFATDTNSPFAYSALGKALVAGATSLTSFQSSRDDAALADGYFQIAVAPQGSTVIQSYGGDDYVLGGPGNDTIEWNDALSDNYRIIDGGSGTINTLVLPGSKLFWGWTFDDTHYDLTELGLKVGELWHINKLVFTFGGEASLKAASTSQEGSTSRDTSEDLVPVVWLDGHAATVQQPLASDTQLIVSSFDYVDVGTRDILITGSAADDIVMLGSGHQVVNGGDGNDILNGVRSAAGSVLEIHGDGGDDVLIGGAGKDIISGGAGRDVLTGGLGDDTFVDTAANLNGDTITDFLPGDRIIISDATIAGFNLRPSGDQLIFAGGSITVSLPNFSSIKATAAPEGGVQITFGGTPIILSAGPSVPLAIVAQQAEIQGNKAQPANLSRPPSEFAPDIGNADHTSLRIVESLSWHLHHSLSDDFLGLA